MAGWHLDDAHNALKTEIWRVLPWLCVSEAAVISSVAGENVEEELHIKVAMTP